MLKRIAVLPVCMPMLAGMPQLAGAVDGLTVLRGPEIPIADNVANDFPRYDVTALCGSAWADQAARSTCVQRQSRLAGLTSLGWHEIPPPARAVCVQRADAAGAARYSVLYACATEAIYRVRSEATLAGIANRVKQQLQDKENPTDNAAVGSIR